MRIHAVVLGVLTILGLCGCGGGIRLSKTPQPSQSGQPDTTIKATICPTLSTEGTSATYVVTRVFVVNLTTAFAGGTVQPDADADGIADSQEAALGFDPLNRRTNGILDSACERLGGINFCTRPSSCTGAMLAPGVTDCDMGNFQSSEANGVRGLDSDLDGVPDFLELVRGLNPVSNDVSGNYDGDSRDNLVELLAGTDILNPDIIPERQQVQFDRRDSAELCGAGQRRVEIEIQNFPLVKIPEFLDDEPYFDGSKPFDLSHDENENVVAIYYVSEPVLSTRLHSELYAAVVKVNSAGIPDKVSLTDTDFLYVGETQK